MDYSGAVLWSSENEQEWEFMHCIIRDVSFPCFDACVITMLIGYFFSYLHAGWLTRPG